MSRLISAFLFSCSAPYSLVQELCSWRSAAQCLLRAQPLLQGNLGDTGTLEVRAVRRGGVHIERQVMISTPVCLQCLYGQVLYRLGYGAQACPWFEAGIAKLLEVECSPTMFTYCSPHV